MTAGKYFQDPTINWYQIYLNKLNPTGNIVWSHIYEQVSGNADAYSIKTDVPGNIYITGNFTETVDFDPGPATFNLNSQVGYNVFVSKLSGSGNFIWAKQMEGVGFSVGTSIALDALNQPHIVGYFDDTTDFDPGTGINNLISISSYDGFICKLDVAGNFIWAKSIAGSSYDQINSVALDNIGNVYSAGYFSNADFDPGPGTFNLTSEGSNDGFISKLDTSGNFVWAQRLGGAQSDVVATVAIDPSTNIYTAGSFSLSVDFDPGPGISILNAKGNPDLFIHKMSQCIPPSALITAVGPTTFCLGDSVNLVANTGAGLTYQWKRTGVSIAGATSFNFVSTTSGNYSVLVSNVQPCSAISNNIIVSVPCIPIGPAQQRLSQFAGLSSQELKVFPNPNKGTFVVDSQSGYVQIFNAFGQSVNESFLQSGEKYFDLSDLPNGIYNMKLITEDASFTKKIILNR